MASREDLQKALKTLSAAGLRGRPGSDELAGYVQLWARLLSEVPGVVLLQAVDDIILSDDFWPTVRRIREAAGRVQSRGLESAAANPWKEAGSAPRLYPWCLTVEPDGRFVPFVVDPCCPRPRRGSTSDLFPPAVWAEVNAILERSGGILGEAERERIHALTDPYVE